MWDGGGCHSETSLCEQGIRWDPAVARVACGSRALATKLGLMLRSQSDASFYFRTHLSVVKLHPVLRVAKCSKNVVALGTAGGTHGAVARCFVGQHEHDE